ERRHRTQPAAWTVRVPSTAVASLCSSVPHTPDAVRRGLRRPEVLRAPAALERVPGGLHLVPLVGVEHAERVRGGRGDARGAGRLRRGGRRLGGVTVPVECLAGGPQGGVGGGRGGRPGGAVGGGAQHLAGVAVQAQQQPHLVPGGVLRVRGRVRGEPVGERRRVVRAARGDERQRGHRVGEPVAGGVRRRAQVGVGRSRGQRDLAGQHGDLVGDGVEAGGAQGLQGGGVRPGPRGGELPVQPGAGAGGAGGEAAAVRAGGAGGAGRPGGRGRGGGGAGRGAGGGAGGRRAGRGGGAAGERGGGGHRRCRPGPGRGARLAREHGGAGEAVQGQQQPLQAGRAAVFDGQGAGDP